MEGNALSEQRMWRLTDAAERRAELAGPDGAQWRAGLPQLIADLERRWGVTVRQSLPGGTAAFVGLATTHAGTDAVLKATIPGLGAALREMSVYREAQGRGYARLLEADEALEAMLLERLGGQLAESDLAAADQIERVCETLAVAWRTPADPSRFESGAAEARRTMKSIQGLSSTYPKLCSERLIQIAVGYCQRREAAFDPGRAVMAHGDGHAENTLADPSHPGAWKFIDPKGLFVEPEYDLGIVMRGWSDDLLEGDALSRGMARCDHLAELTGLRREAIWEWGFIERVASGLYCEQLGLKDWSASFLAVAEAWAVI